MTTYGLIVEGSYDAAALKELIKKCASIDNLEIVSRVCGGSIMKRFPGHLEEFRHVCEGCHVDKAFVVRDADTKDNTQILDDMRKKISARKYQFEVKLIPIVQELETWLLSDERAISKVTQSRGGRPVSRVNKTLECVVNPKEELQKILGEAGLFYTEEVAREIAMESNLATIEYRCLLFRNFVQDVRDC